MNNRINPALFSPAAVKIAGLLPTTSDPCGQIAYSRPTKPTEDMPIGRIDWQLNPNHSLFARYMLSTTFWDPAFVNADGNILAATLGGRDNTVHSLAIGDSMVLNNTMVNNIRVSVSRTSVMRTHSELFGPEDVGVNMFTYIPEYMNLTVTGAFSINTGTETFSYYKPNTYSLSDDLTMVRGNHQFGFGGAVAMSDWKTESNVRSMGPMSFNGGATGLPLADFLLGRVFEFREATPFRQDIKQPYFALYAQDTWRVSPNVTLQLRRAVGTVVPAGQRGQGGLHLRRRSDVEQHAQHGVPAGAGRPLLSRRPRVPGQFRHEHRVVELRASRGRVVGSRRRRPHVGACRIRPDR